jgi:hypothetical protein
LAPGGSLLDYCRKCCDKYDEDLVIEANYKEHIKYVEAFLKLELERKVAILDLAAGTGLLGAEVTCRGCELVLVMSVEACLVLTLLSRWRPTTTRTWRCWARPGGSASTGTTSWPWWRGSNPNRLVLLGIQTPG